MPVQNWHEEFEKFWPEHSRISKICTLLSCFWQKYIMFELNSYRVVMFDGTEYWCKIWKKTDLCFQKWHEEFGKFSPEHVSKSKNWDFYWILLSKSRKCMSLKFTEELCVMTMKNDVKFEEDLTYQFKLTWGIWQIWTQALENLKKLHFNGLLLTKVYKCLN